MQKHNLLSPYNVALRSCLNCGCHFCTMGNSNPLLLVLFLGTFVSSDGWSHTQTDSISCQRYHSDSLRYNHIFHV